MGFVALWHVESSWTRDQNPCPLHGQAESYLAHTVWDTCGLTHVGMSGGQRHMPRGLGSRQGAHWGISAQELKPTGAEITWEGAKALLDLSHQGKSCLITFKESSFCTGLGF